MNFFGHFTKKKSSGNFPELLCIRQIKKSIIMGNTESIETCLQRFILIFKSNFLFHKNHPIE